MEGLQRDYRESLMGVSEEKVKYNSDRKDHSSYPLEIKKSTEEGEKW